MSGGGQKGQKRRLFGEPSDADGTQRDPNRKERKSGVKEGGEMEGGAKEGEEGWAEVHEGYDREESEGPPIGKRSRLAFVRAEDHQAFLSSPPMSRGEALRSMGVLERMVYEFLIILTPLSLLCKIWQFAQKSVQWLWARTGRLTGSHTSVAVGHQRGTPIMKGPYESIFSKFKGNKASQWGSGKEVYATQCYCNDFKRLVTHVFRSQRREKQLLRLKEGGKERLYFVFRNQRIPVPNIDQDPEVEVRHYGLLIDPWNHHRGVSPDGIVFVNGVAVGVLEVKCAYAQQKSLYPNIHTYYFDQIQSELYIGHLYWPTIQWVDFVVWSPQHFTVDTFTFDAHYYYQWYAPREIRYYFKLYLPTLAEKIKLLTQHEHHTENPSQELLQKTIKREFTMPDPPPKPELSTVTSGHAQLGLNTEIDRDWHAQLLQIDLDLDLSSNKSSNEGPAAPSDRPEGVGAATPFNSQTN